MELTDLDALKAFPSTYPQNLRTFYSPADGTAVHEALKAVIGGAQHSVVVSAYGYDDDELDAILHTKASDPNIYFQMVLDRSQAGGVHERELLASWNAGQVGTSISVGTSEKGAIQHMKAAVIDGRFVITGSTNWSSSGESLQDNQLTVLDDAVAAAELRSRIDVIHDAQLKQMAARAAAANPTPAAPAATEGAA